MILNKQSAAKKNKPKEILKCLEINKGDNVVDIGSGGGYYSYEFSKEVGENGQVYSIDIDERYLKYIRKIASSKGIDNINTVLSERTDGVFRHVKKNNKSVSLHFSNLTTSAKVANTLVLTTFTSLSNSKNPKNL